jgi:hypothetical protein
MIDNKELWLRNPGTSDVSLSDLGVKVRAGKTVNVYKVNPYITVAQVNLSIKNGSLRRRLDSNTLHVVRKQVNPVPPDLNRIKQSDGTVHAKKTKTSVVIETNFDGGNEDDVFDFADYGIGDLNPVIHEKQENGSVVTNTKSEKEEKLKDDAVLKPEIEYGTSQQSQVVMKVTREAMVNPIGPIAKSSVVTAEKPFTVIDPDIADNKNHQEVQEEIKSVDEVAVKTQDGSVIMEIREEDKPKENKNVVIKRPKSSKEK